MKSLRSINRKREKAKARRKDFVRRKNINANVPTTVRFEKKEKYRSLGGFENDGKTPRLEVAGEKTVAVKSRKYLLNRRGIASLPRVENDSISGYGNRVYGMIEYPKRKKMHDPIPTSKTSIRRAEWAKRKELLNNK